MRTIVRVGGLVGAVAFIMLYAGQTGIALAVAPGVMLAGICAGLGIAKWMEREWYGRQLDAGLRAGAIASGLAGLGALLSLLFLGPRDTTSLAAGSHLAMLDLAPVVRSFAFLGWVGTDVLTVIVAAFVGAVLGAVVCQIFAWSKSAYAVKVIAQARLAAQALNRDEVYRATGAPSTYGSAAQASNMLAQLGVSTPGVASVTGVTPALGIIPPPTFSPSSVPAPVSQQRFTAGPASSPAPVVPEHALTEPALPAAPTAANTPTGRRSPSAARRAEAELTQAMRDALAAWADNTVPETKKPPEAKTGEKAKPSRTPAPSAYLNSSPPAKRGRKKSDTQDWLC
jgi:hypothetical protein